MTISGAIGRASGALKPMGKRLISKPIYSSSAMRGAMIGAGIGAGVGGIKSGIQGDSIIGGAVSGAIGGGVLGAGINAGRSMYTANKRLKNIASIRSKKRNSVFGILQRPIGSKGNISTAMTMPANTAIATGVVGARRWSKNSLIGRIRSSQGL